MNITDPDRTRPSPSGNHLAGVGADVSRLRAWGNLAAPKVTIPPAPRLIFVSKHPVLPRPFCCVRFGVTMNAG